MIISVLQKNSLNIRKWISEANYSRYIMGLAETFVEMGSLYEKADYEKAEKFYLKASAVTGEKRATIRAVPKLAKLVLHTKTSKICCILLSLV